MKECLRKHWKKSTTGLSKNLAVQFRPCGSDVIVACESSKLDASGQNRLTAPFRVVLENSFIVY